MMMLKLSILKYYFIILFSFPESFVNFSL